MQKEPWLLVVRVASLLALLASAALLGDYVAGSPSFCSATSGCGVVRSSPLSHVRLGDGLYLPLPALGLLGFSVVFASSFFSRRTALLASAGLGGVVALGLLFVQAFQLRAFCWLCVTTDVAALVAAVAALLSVRGAPEAARSSGLKAWAWAGLAAWAVVTPLAWSAVKPSPPVPAAVLRHYLPGRINVIEFADFQCPACRKFHLTLKPALKSFGDRVHFVRLNKPLPSHPNARDAARAAVCAEVLEPSKREAMADALFAAQDLSPAGIDRLAQAVGLEPAGFERCLLAPETDARVEREAGLLVPPELEGLPTTYVGSRRLVGAYDEAGLRDALESAERGDGVTGVAWPVYLAAALGLLAALLVAGRRPHLAPCSLRA